MALTRFKDARSGLDGPVSGALIVIPVQFTSVATNVSVAQTIDLPAGMNLELVAINVQALGITSDPSITVGTAKGGTQIVAATNITTNLGDLTLKATSLTAGGILDIKIITDTGDSLTSGSVTVFGYVSAPPTSVEYR